MASSNRHWMGGVRDRIKMSRKTGIKDATDSRNFVHHLRTRNSMKREKPQHKVIAQSLDLIELLTPVEFEHVTSDVDTIDNQGVIVKMETDTEDTYSQPMYTDTNVKSILFFDEGVEKTQEVNFKSQVPIPVYIKSELRAQQPPSFDHNFMEFNEILPSEE